MNKTPPESQSPAPNQSKSGKSPVRLKESRSKAGKKPSLVPTPKQTSRPLSRSNIATATEAGLEEEGVREVLQREIYQSKIQVPLLGRELTSKPSVNVHREYLLKIQSVSGENIFWNGGFQLKPNIDFRFNGVDFSLSLGEVLIKFLPSKLVLKLGLEKHGEVAMVDSNFRPLSPDVTLDDLFEPDEPEQVIYLRLIREDEDEGPVSPVPSLQNYKMRPDLKLRLVESSDRKIIWDQHSLSFQTQTDLKFKAHQTAKLRVEDVLTYVMASNYVRPEGRVVSHKFWTDEIAVVSLLDTLDMLSNEKFDVVLRFQLAENTDELEWIELIDMINRLFAKSLSSKDANLLRLYEDGQVLQEMEVLKSKILCDEKNVPEIKSLFRTIENKINQALGVTSIHELANSDSDPQQETTDTLNRNFSHIQSTKSELQESEGYGQLQQSETSVTATSPELVIAKSQGRIASSHHVPETTRSYHFFGNDATSSHKSTTSVKSLYSPDELMHPSTTTKAVDLEQQSSISLKKNKSKVKPKLWAW